MRSLRIYILYYLLKAIRTATKKEVQLSGLMLARAHLSRKATESPSLRQTSRIKLRSTGL